MARPTRNRVQRARRPAEVICSSTWPQSPLTMRVKPSKIDLLAVTPNMAREAARSDSTLRDAQPESASVIIRKRNRSRFDWSPDFHLTSVTRSERKLADMSLSAVSLKLEAGESEHTVRLLDI